MPKAETTPAFCPCPRRRCTLANIHDYLQAHHEHVKYEQFKALGLPLAVGYCLSKHLYHSNWSHWLVDSAVIFTIQIIGVVLKVLLSFFENIHNKHLYKIYIQSPTGLLIHRRHLVLIFISLLSSHK